VNAVLETGDAALARCFHCGEALPPVPAYFDIDGASRAFCCDGCAAAAQWIRDADLGDYYRLRSEAASRVGSDESDFSAWDRDDVVADHAREVEGGREITVVTDGMRCAACAWLIDRALTREPGIVDVGANAVTGRIRLTWNPAVTPLSAPLRRLALLGYRPYLAAGHADESARRRARNRSLLRIGLASLGAMQAMMFGEALYLDTSGSMAVATRDFLRWVTFLVSTPVVFYAGWPFLEGAWRELTHRRLGMDVLVATSTLLAYAASVAETVRGGPHVWYDAAVMFVFLLLVARSLEERVRRQDEHAAVPRVSRVSRIRGVRVLTTVAALWEREERDGQPVLKQRFGVDEDICTGDHACIRLSGCPSLSVKVTDDPLRDDPVATIDNSCVACGNCGEVADAAVLCPSFYRADVLHNAPGWTRLWDRLRKRIISALQSRREAGRYLFDRSPA
jgi:hypothetical protein